MEAYILSLEKELSLIENGFKKQERIAQNDFKIYDKATVKRLAFAAFKSNEYQVRMYGEFLFPILSKS